MKVTLNQKTMAQEKILSHAALKAENTAASAAEAMPKQTFEDQTVTEYQDLVTRCQNLLNDTTSLQSLIDKFSKTMTDNSSDIETATKGLV